MLLCKQKYRKRRLEWLNRKYAYNDEKLRVGGQMQIGENLWLLLFGTISHHKKDLFFFKRKKTQKMKE